MVFQTLETLIFQRGIKRKAIAEALNISTRSLNNKLKGRVAFTWPEVCIIQKRFFPDVPKEILFSESKSA